MRRLHNLFKFEFIAPRQLAVGESYTITSEEIDAWLAERDRAAHVGSPGSAVEEMG